MVKHPKHFVVNLKAAHDATGLSPYMVGKTVGVATNTVVKYTEKDNVITERLEISLMALMNFYGVDWRDPNVIKVVFEESPPEGQTKTPLAIPA